MRRNHCSLLSESSLLRTLSVSGSVSSFPLPASVLWLYSLRPAFKMIRLDIYHLVWGFPTKMHSQLRPPHSFLRSGPYWTSLAWSGSCGQHSSHLTRCVKVHPLRSCVTSCETSRFYGVDMLSELEMSLRSPWSWKSKIGSCWESIEET